MEAESNGRIEAQQVASYRKEGYLLYDQPIFSAEKYQRLADRFDTLLAALNSDQRPEGMGTPHVKDPTLFEWLLADEVLDLIEPILGPDIVLFSSHFICKPSGDGRRVPWHEDSSYWKGLLEPPLDVVTVWLALDRSDQENGCMRVIPGSHMLGGYSEYEPVDDKDNNVFGTQITATQFDESKAIDLVLDSNHASLHDGRIMHASEPNLSTRRRCGYTMRYFSATAKYIGYKAHKHIYMARGRDRADNTYFEPGA
jgi:chlorinating enzyme